MPLLKNGKIVEDVWAHIEDGHELSPGGCFTVSLSRFLSEHDQLLADNRSIGVRLAVSEDPTLLAPHLERLHLIELQFPKYTDGRAFSQAQLLRRRFGFRGGHNSVRYRMDLIGRIKRAHCGRRGGCGCRVCRKRDAWPPSLRTQAHHRFRKACCLGG